MTTTPMTLGERLRALRLATGCTMTEIALAAGLMIEDVRITEDPAVTHATGPVIEALARVYGVSLDDLTTPGPGGRSSEGA